MNYISISFYILLLLIIPVYYLLPLRHRWCALLAGSGVFYFFASGSLPACLCFLAMIMTGWAIGLLTGRLRSAGGRRWLISVLSLCTLIPLILFKLRGGADGTEGIFSEYKWLAPIGLSYFSLQMYSYLFDVGKGRIEPQRNPFRFILYMSFFPQVIQGPIPKYEELSPQLYEGNRYRSENIVSGMQLVVWGFFLKYMIADRADVVVSQIFEGYMDMTGAVILLGGVLYSIQLYADFLACVTISQGVAEFFGIKLRDNFAHPYFAPTVQDFWRRWHMSLSFWLRDYVYIPLGGNRKGKIRKYINLILTFLVSGFWHGGLALNFIFWGLLHAFYQVVGGLTIGLRNRALKAVHISPSSVPVRLIRAGITCFLVMTAWIIFRAGTLADGLNMLLIMTGGITWTELKELMPTILRMGAFMDPAEWYMLFISSGVLLIVSLIQSRRSLRELINGLWLPIRWAVYICAMLAVMIFGSYGHGFNAADFIYGGF